MGGLGKTTIARVYYDRIRWQFEGSCFIDVKEVFEKHGPLCLQEQLLSQILREDNIKIWDTQNGIYEIKKRLQQVKMFLILDNVDNQNQLEVLAVELASFHPGSRIIITSRDRYLLKIVKDDSIYDLKVLDDDDALMLFRRKAFKQDPPIPYHLYESLSRRVVHYANGLPLALEVLGSFLQGRSVTVWENAIARLHKIPNREIQDVLQVSYDGLEELEKKIFLDIACFFKGVDKDRVTWILNNCGFYADIGLDVLIGKSLISISSQNKIQMHDLLQAMGREIVRLESSEDPGRRSRLWVEDDIFHVLVKNSGGEQIEGISLELPEKQEPKWNMDSFSKLIHLRLLKISAMHLIKGPIYLSDELRLLDWHGYPSKSLPTSFHPKRLCELRMPYSCMQQLWDGIKLLEKLRIMDLSHSEYLIKTPDFVGIPNLEKLILRGCTSLKSIHSSLTSSIHLKILDLSGCCKLANVPENFERLECLEKLDMRETAIKQPPASIFGLKYLKKFSFDGFKGEPYYFMTKHSSNLSPYFQLFRRSSNPIGLVLPSLRGLYSLRTLNLSYCKIREGALPCDLGCLASLQSLDLSGNDFVSLPTSINQLSSLEKLWLEDCRMLESLAEIPSRNMSIMVNGCDSLLGMPDPINLGKEIYYYCLDCVKFNENNGGDSLAYRMLIRYIQGHHNPETFGIIIPGSKTPEWFSHQSGEATIGLEMPPCSSIFEDAECSGLAFCIPFVPNSYWRIRFVFHGIGNRIGWTMPYVYKGRRGVRKFKGIPHLWSCFISSDLLRRIGFVRSFTESPGLYVRFIWASYEVSREVGFPHSLQ